PGPAGGRADPASSRRRRRPARAGQTRTRPDRGVQGAAEHLAGRRDRPHGLRQGRLRLGARVHRVAPGQSGGVIMHTPVCDKLGIEYPIVGFTPSEHVAAAISRAGGLGVLGCVRFNDAKDLDSVLDWMDANTDGRPYGVDVVMPAKIPTEGTAVDLDKLIPPEHRAFVERTLDQLGVPPLPTDEREAAGVLGWLHSVARSHVEVALNHPIKLIANALGS